MLLINHWRRERKERGWYQIKETTTHIGKNNDTRDNKMTRSSGRENFWGFVYFKGFKKLFGLPKKSLWSHCCRPTCSRQAPHLQVFACFNSYCKHVTWLCPTWSLPSTAAALQEDLLASKQEQTKFDDLRRGITKDFQRLAKFQAILSDLRFWPFVTSKWPQNSNLTWSVQHNLGVPEIFNFIKFSVWALLGP